MRVIPVHELQQRRNPNHRDFSVELGRGDYRCSLMHMSGRAQLTHPVRQRTGLQRGRDASAEADRAPLRLSSGVTVTGDGAAECSPWFPPLGPPVGSALSSTGSSEASSPAATGLWRCATPWVPRAALRCLRLPIPGVVPVISLPTVQDTKPRAWGWSSGPRARTNTPGDLQGLPGSWRTLVSLCPVLRPRQDLTQQACYAVAGAAPALSTAKAPATELSGLNGTALGLAVYASRCPLPEHHARLASGR
jgi:hypothetical protein